MTDDAQPADATAAARLTWDTPSFEVLSLDAAGANVGGVADGGLYGS